MLINTVGLIAHKYNPAVVETLNEIIQVLEHRGVRVLLDRSNPFVDEVKHVELMAVEELGNLSDLVVVVGGDGTLLGSARKLAKFGVPILGVNRGKLGFLADIVPGEIDRAFGPILDGEFHSEERFLFEVTLTRGGVEIAHSLALNDVVLHPGQSVTMIEFEAYIDGQFVYSMCSDGVIISTPTGSTAYNLSAGGPIMHPSLNAFVLVPMFAHGLNNRPVVVPGASDIRLVIATDNRTHPRVTCDGQTHIATQPGDELHVKQYAKPVKLIHPAHHNFYEICRSKLGWGSPLV